MATSSVEHAKVQMYMASEHITRVARIEALILTVRGLRVMLDSDLAKVYGVTTGQLNQALKRSHDRFPRNFAFQLTRQEFTALISQNVISKIGPGGRTKLPWVFTEHGAVMLASVLNSPAAIKASIRVVETFMLMREQLAAHKELAHKLAELEKQVSGHDSQIQNLFEAIRQLIEPPLPEKRKEIGFHMRETAPGYRVNVRPRE